jgi:predicted nucleic acid-binding protein
MNAKCFLDTNILVYLFDQSEANKHQKIKQIFAELGQTTEMYISAQVVNEFIVVASQKIQHPIPLDEVEHILDFFKRRLHIIPLNLGTSLKAIEYARRYGYSFWDCLILASALETQCSILYSEDMQHEQIIENTLTILDPFKKTNP